MKDYELDRLFEIAEDDLDRTKTRIALLQDYFMKSKKHNYTVSPIKERASLKRQIIETRESLNTLRKALSKEI